MTLRIHQLTLPLDYKEQDLREAAAAKLGCNEMHLDKVTIIRRSIDARPQRKKPVYVISVELTIKGLSVRAEDVRSADIEFLTQKDNEPYAFPSVALSLPTRPSPVIIGAGPAGLMAALALAQAGLSPILFERGDPVAERIAHVRRFWEQGALNPESNVLFGEGGAGLFSDGKLIARSKDRKRVRYFLETLVRCGAPRSILIDAEPHLGSDLLSHIVPAIRHLIERAGGEMRFHARLEGIAIEKGALRGIQVNGEKKEVSTCILAPGHSARDVYTMLAQAGVPMEPKSFAVGVRVELPQHIIDTSRFGRYAGHPCLGAASFRLTRKAESSSRACYTFCMCPGGKVISCASSDGFLTTNGMSLSKRSGDFGNAAFLVPVSPADFPTSCKNETPASAGIEFQMGIEHAAYIEGGSDYSVPAALLTDFISGTPTKNLPSTRSWHRSKPADIRCILPDFVCDTLSIAIPKMLRLLKGIHCEDALLYASETRTSSPVRILRNEKRESVVVNGLYPAGEGSGYTGGIVSSALDGLRAAEALIKTYYRGEHVSF
ncbi:MAG: NAD(P)/FAD-dependent oxidoreductase [bacterium]